MTTGQRGVDLAVCTERRICVQMSVVEDEAGTEDEDGSLGGADTTLIVLVMTQRDEKIIHLRARMRDTSQVLVGCSSGRVLVGRGRVVAIDVPIRHPQ